MEQTPAHQDPENPSRRHALKLIGGAGLFVAGGGTIWAISQLSQSDGTLQPGPGAEPNSLIGNGPTSTFADSSTTTAGGTIPLARGELLPGVTRDDLPTSISDPEVWMNKIYNLFDMVYNTHNYEVLDFVYYNGLAGTMGEALRYDAEIVRITKTADESTDDTLTITGTLVPERTRTENGRQVVGVESRILFKDQDIHRIMDYTVTQKVVYHDLGGTTEKMNLFLISSAEQVCQFEGGICR